MLWVDDLVFGWSVCLKMYHACVWLKDHNMLGYNGGTGLSLPNINCYQIKLLKLIYIFFPPESERWYCWMVLLYTIVYKSDTSQSGLGNNFLESNHSLNLWALARIKKKVASYLGWLIFWFVAVTSFGGVVLFFNKQLGILFVFGIANQLNICMSKIQIKHLPDIS